MGELLTNHHGVEVEAVESMEMAPGVNPCPGRVPEQELLTPKTCLRWRRSCGTLSGIWLIVLGFSGQEHYIGERMARGVAESASPRGGATPLQAARGHGE